MKTLFSILDGIIDQDGITDAFAHLSDLEYIESYANNGMDVYPSNEQIKKISRVGLDWINHVKNGGLWSLYRDEAESNLNEAIGEN